MKNEEYYMRILLLILSIFLLNGCIMANKNLNYQYYIGLWPKTMDLVGMQDAFQKTSEAANGGMMQIPLIINSDNSFYHKNYDYLFMPIWNNKNMFEQYGIKKAICLDFLVSDDRTKLNFTGTANTFLDQNVCKSFINQCVWLADYFNPDYLAIGTEIDEYIRVISNTERTALLNSITSSIKQIHSKHPNMKVFVYFQYENVVNKNLWTSIKPFANASDVNGFSTYPSLRNYNSIKTTNTYFNAINSKLNNGKKIVFAEMGHPSSVSAIFKGTQEEQVSFIAKIKNIVPTNTDMITWIALYNPYYPNTTADQAAYFGSMGLINSNSNESYSAWKSITY